MKQDSSELRRCTTLEIVWRNPVSAPFNQQRIEQLLNDDYGSVYAARGAGGATTVFEVIRHGGNEAATDFTSGDSPLETRVRVEESLRKVRL